VANAQYNGGTVRNRAIRYQSVLGTALVLISAHIPSANVNHVERSQVVKFTSAYGSPRALLSFVPAAPFAQADWPNPRGYAPRPDFSDSFKLPLTTHKGTAQYDWPVPRGAKPVVADWTSSFLLPLTTHKGTAQYDWPVPRGAKPVVADWKSSFPLPLTTVKGTAQYDWPNPQLPRRSEQLGSVQGGLGLTTAVVYPASITFDWPNPRGPLQYHRGISDSFKLPLTTHKGVNQYNWPNPAGARRNEALGQTGSGLALNNPAAVDSEHIPLSPISAAKWTRTTSFTSAYGSPIGLLTAAVVAPFHQSDWPNPTRLTPRAVADWSDKFKLPLTTVRGRSNYDWPNPTRATVRRQDFTHRNFALFQTGPLIPVAGLKIFRSSLAVTTTAYNRALYSAPPLTPVTVTFDWPNPRGYVPNVGLRTSDGRWFHITETPPAPPTCLHVSMRVCYGSATYEIKAPDAEMRVKVGSATFKMNEPDSEMRVTTASTKLKVGDC
jgi:hypothetical protein